MQRYADAQKVVQVNRTLCNMNRMLCKGGVTTKELIE